MSCVLQILQLFGHLGHLLISRGTFLLVRIAPATKYGAADPDVCAAHSYGFLKVFRHPHTEFNLIFIYFDCITHFASRILKGLKVRIRTLKLN